MRARWFSLLPIFVIFLQLNGFVEADDPVTPKDKAALKKFRPMVEHFLPHDWMKTDGYLLRWIRTKKYDLESAKDLLKKNVEWRKENNIDNLKNDRTSAIGREFKIDVEGVDNEGRPVMLVDWTADVRKHVIAGKRKQLSMHLASAMELVDRKTREKNIHGNNTQWIGIYDFDKFTSQTHLCVQCLPTYLDHAIYVESYYPLAAKDYYLINAPRIFQTVLRLVQPILKETLDRVNTMGNDRKHWQSVLLSKIPADQLPHQFGGTRKV